MFEEKTEVTQYESGLTLVSSFMPNRASVSFGIWLGIGGRYENEANNGVSHFIEHMLFKGTQKRSARDISQEIEGVGGTLNAFTSEENTCYYARAPHYKLKVLIEVFFDMYFESTFDPTEIEKERGVIQEEISMYMDQPHQYVLDLLNETLWPHQPLGRCLTGTTESLARLDRETILNYKNLHYTAPNTVLAVAGPHPHSEVKALLEPFLKRFQPGNRSNFEPVRDIQKKPVLKHLHKEVEQAQMALGIRAFSRHDPKVPALRVMNALLGENMSSRLFQTIREEHALAYSIYSTPSFFQDTGDLVISAGVAPEDMSKCLKLIQFELERFTKELPPRRELQQAKDYLLGQLALNLENTENMMTWIGEQWLNHGRVIPWTQIHDEIQKVRPSEIRRLSQDLFQSNRMNLTVISPLKRIQTLKLYLNFGSTSTFTA